jgi:prepilin-type N-terminal cleavage/methylation domain-containing protein
MKDSGFTLIESLITTVLLVSGLAAVAAAFSYSSITTSHVLQETAAIALVSGKIENLRAAGEWPVGRYSEYLVVTSDGDFAISEPGSATYFRTWEVSSEVPARVTVIVYGRRPRHLSPSQELARATTLLGQRF